MLVRIDRRLILFLLFYGCVLLIPIWQLSLVETTEARYGEIAREMLASGNFLEPTLNGIFHFHKPPAPYWFMAAGMAIFGVNDFGVRFFGIVAALTALYFLYLTARIFFNDRSQAFAATLILASSPLFFAISRAVSTDIYLTTCVIGAQYYLFRQVYGERTTGNALGYGLFLGIGFMCKGPVIFLFTILPQLAAKLVDPRHRRLFSFKEILCGAGCFLTVSFPWYLAVVLRHPDLLTYFLKVQTVDRFATERFHRNKPFWFFLYLFPATFLPYSFTLLRGFWRAREYPPRVRALLIYVCLPLLVFCFSKSKLPPYILPFFGTASVLAVYTYFQLRSQWDNKAAFVILLIMSFGIGIAGFVSSPLNELRWALAFAGFLLFMFCLASQRLFSTDWAQHSAPWLMIGIFVVAYLALPHMEGHMKGYRTMVTKLNEMDPQRKVPTLLYMDFLPSISFYRQELAIVAMTKPRETDFEINDNYRNWYVQNEVELKEKLSKMPRVFVVTEPKHIGAFVSSMSFSCSEILALKNDIAYDCRPETLTPSR